MQPAMNTRTIITGIAALFLATGTAHADDSKGIPARECPTVLTSDFNKLENQIEVNACIYKWNVYVANHPEEKGVWMWSWPPPAEYDIPYSGVLMLQRMSIDQLHRVCPNRQTLACSFKKIGNAGCLIIMPPDEYIEQHSRQDPNKVFRHELGHCNGWPGDHPGSQSKWEWVSGPRTDGFDPAGSYVPPPPRDPFEGIPSTSYPPRPGSGPGSGG
jgi:hypothetical protein